MIKVLVVDDSAVLRQSTKFILESDPDLKVIGEAGNGLEAIALANRLRPDVITMDIRMPMMDGLEAIRQIMTEKPAPIVVVTSLDRDRGMNLSTQATRLGAVSVLSRPDSVTTPTYKTFVATLIRQVKLMSSVKLVHRTYEPKLDDTAPVMAQPVKATVKTEIVAVGSSTGGPAALHKVLSALPATFPLPIVIVQHISFGFVAGLADWLNDTCAIQVKVGQDGERLRSGVAYLAPDEQQLMVDRFGKINLNKNEPVGGFRPSATTLFQSVAYAYGAGALGAILTGMGSDGAPGLLSMRKAGAITLAQDEESCVVFGMPKEAIALGAVQHVVPLDRMAGVIQGLIVTAEPEGIP